MFFIRKKIKKSLPLSLKKEDRYIFFSFYGLLHWLILFLFFSLSLNYGSNIGIISSYLLFVVYVSVIFNNFFAINKIILTEIDFTPDYYIRDNHIYITFKTNKKINPNAIYWVKIKDKKFKLYWVNGEASVKYTFTNHNVGLYWCPSIKIYTYWPICLTKTWVNIHINKKIKILPYKKTEFYNKSCNKLLNNNSKIKEKVIINNDDDISYIRHVFEKEIPKKIAWKQSYKTGKKMVYEFNNKKYYKSYKVISYTDINTLSVEINKALDNKEWFKIIHPKFTSNINNTEVFAKDVLSKIMDYEYTVQKW